MFSCLNYGNCAMCPCHAMCLLWWNVWLIECWDICCWYVRLRVCFAFLLMRICAIWIEEWIGVVELSPCMEANCEIWLWWNWVEIMIKWCYDEMWKYEYWWKVNYSLHLCLSNFDEFENESNPKRAGTPACESDMRRGLPQVKKKMGGDSRNWKEIMRRGLPQEKEKNGGDSRKKKKRMAGTPAREKEMYMAGTPAIEWWYGGDSHKKRAGTPAMYGVANLISKHERGGNWHYTV